MTWTVEDAIYAAEAKRDLANAMANVVRAIRTLDPAQGPLGRRNARQRVVKALKGVQAVVDRVYPAPARKAPKQVKRRTVLQRRKDLISQGYLIITGDVLAAMAEAKITVVRTPKHEFKSGALPDKALLNSSEIAIPHHGQNTNPYIRPAVWAPGWAVHYYTLGKRGSSLLQIRKNVPMIRAALAAIRLGSIAQAMNGDIRCPAI